MAQTPGTLYCAAELKEAPLAPSTELLIGDAGGEHVLIRALSRKHPGLFDSWDANWIACEIEVAVGGFHGAFRADLRSDEFLAFSRTMDDLAVALDSVATFSTMEQQLSVLLAGDGRGHVRVEGSASDTAGSGNRLHFSFEIDQTYLKQIQRDLEVILEAFPVVGTDRGER